MKLSLAKFGIDGFLIGIICMVLLGYFFPGPGIATSPVSLEEIAGYGISVIFLFYGIKISPKQMKAGLVNWKMHLLIQATTFLFFPLLVIAVKPLFVSEQASLIWLGTFFLASLPSTVSSSVVMVSIAKGNIPAAIFNATISSLLGIVFTPLWTGLFIASDVGGFDVSSVVIKSAVQVLLPAIIGMLLHHRLGAFAQKNSKRLKLFDQSIILLIIYTSFSHSFAEHLFDGFAVSTLLLLMAGMLLLFLAVLIITYSISKLLGFNMEDGITVMLCGSKKSLVHGTVMSKILFPNSTIMGIIIMPLMLYHALQLIASGIIAQRLARREMPGNTTTV